MAPSVSHVYPQVDQNNLFTFQEHESSIGKMSPNTQSELRYQANEDYVADAYEYEDGGQISFEGTRESKELPMMNTDIIETQPAIKRP